MAGAATDLIERDDAIAEALTAGRPLRAVRREFGLSAAELDGALERLFPIDIAARIRLIKRDVGRLASNRTRNAHGTTAHGR